MSYLEKIPIPTYWKTTYALDWTLGSSSAHALGVGDPVKLDKRRSPEAYSPDKRHFHLRCLPPNGRWTYSWAFILQNQYFVLTIDYQGYLCK